MKKLYFLVALLMATTSAHAGGISFEIEGQRVRIEAPRNCNSLSCISITAPGFKGLKSKRYDDDDDVAYRNDRRDDRNYRDDPPPAKYAPAPAPVQAAAPLPAAPVAVPAAPAPQPAPVAAAPASDPNSPLGVWAT